MGLEATHEIQGEGELRVALSRKGVSMGDPLAFPLPVVGAFRPVELVTKSTHGAIQEGQQGLADGDWAQRIFDGSWQATQGEHMGVTVQLDALTEIDSLSMQVYRYQDA